MGNHTAVKIQSRWIKNAGVQVHPDNSRIRIGNGNFATAWPVLANRLEVQGHLGEVVLNADGIILEVNIDHSSLANWLQGHRKTKSSTKVWLLLAVAALVVGFLACIPLGDSKVIAKAPTGRKSSSPCAVTALEDWLVGKQKLDEPTLGDSSSIGGIVVGILECDGSRYSYTLGLKEPKRVLNLKKLNS